MAGNVLYASLFEKDIHRLDLHDLPVRQEDGPELLNVLRFTDLPQVAAIAGNGASCGSIRTSRRNGATSPNSPPNSGGPKSRSRSAPG